MDSVLLEYLRSGRAWVLVGSGPSNAMGFPSWHRFAEQAVSMARSAGSDAGEVALAEHRLPAVFEEVASVVGLPALVQELRRILAPRDTNSAIYDELARWPIPVYLTTNFDDALSEHVSRVDPTYRVYGNSDDHLALLIPGFSGAIVKLHGDLTSTDRLVLTESQYRAVKTGADWEGWRTKIRSIVQMVPLVVIGHSMTDPHVEMVLQEAKEGAGVVQPVVWLAPDVPLQEARDYLERYRVRVVSYQNSDGSHRNLTTLIRDYGRFVPPRSTVRTSAQTAAVVTAGAQANAGAPAFYVFNRLSMQPDATEKRIQVALATIEVAMPLVDPDATFTLRELLEIAGWPGGAVMAPEFERVVIRRATAAKLLVRQSDGKLRVGRNPPRSRSGEFEHLRDRFLASLRLRLQRDFPDLESDDVDRVAQDVHDSLTGFFRKGGLTLATVLFNPADPGDEQRFLPSSIAGFMSDASARYETHLLRQAFVHLAIACFVEAESAERAFLGRLSQGFFAFHALGAFGEVAVERLSSARDAVWLIDSNVQIPAVALAAPSNSALRETLRRLAAARIRLFTTQKLFDETVRHLSYAQRVVERWGADSYDVVASANGYAPYRAQNQFLQGFIQWQQVPNPPDWPRYLFESLATVNLRTKKWLSPLKASAWKSSTSKTGQDSWKRTSPRGTFSPSD